MDKSYKTNRRENSKNCNIKSINRPGNTKDLTWHADTELASLM